MLRDSHNSVEADDDEYLGASVSFGRAKDGSRVIPLGSRFGKLTHTIL
jgi:hypothetical protein